MEALAIRATEQRADEVEDEWPTTMRFSRRLGELYRGADYGNAIDGPYSRSRFLRWNKVGSWLLVAWMMVMLASAAGQAGYLWTSAFGGP